MNTHDIDIELPPLPEFDRLSSMHADDVANLLSSYGRKCARAAIEADRKRIAELEAANAELERLCDETYVAQGADAYNLACEEMEDWQADRRKAGKEVGTTGSLCDGIQWLYGYIEELEAKRRGEPVLVGWAVSTTGKGMLPASRYTEFEARRAGYSLPVYRLSASQPAEPGSTHHVHRGTESLPCYCNGTYDHPIGKETLEPVKVPSDADAKHVQDFIDCDGMGAVIVEGPQYSAVVRALLARYSHLTAPTHKSSNQNQLKG